MNIVHKTLTASLLALSVSSAFAAGSPGVEQRTQAFLEALEQGGGKPLEQLSPKDARAVLTGAQASVKVDLSGIEVKERTIEADGQSIAAGGSPGQCQRGVAGIHVLPWRWLGARRLPDPPAADP